jgi:hypothetical protein
MAIYQNSSQKSALDSVEFSTVKGDNATFYYLKPGADITAFKTWLEDQGIDVQAQSAMGNRTVLFTRDDKSDDAILSALKERGDILKEHVEKKKINMWKIRGLGSTIGQPMQLISGFLSKGLDIATIGFAISNMAANLINMFVGAQKEDDEHQLRFIKRHLNKKLEPLLKKDNTLINVDDDRSAKYHKKETLGERAYNFVKRYSVTGGDIGLRFIGSISLAFPIVHQTEKTTKEGKKVISLSFAHWKDAFKAATQGEFKSAYNIVKNSKDKATYLGGMLYIIGKTISLASKVEDPYNKEQKHSWVDTLREKVAFRLSSVIEATAAGIIALDRFNLIAINKDANGVHKLRTLEYDKMAKMLKDLKLVKETPKWLLERAGKATSRDWLGGVGASMFTLGLLIRIFAPFGVREVDMTELYAHTTDTLAMVPPKKLPQAVSDAAAQIADHFKGKGTTFGQVYAQLTADLKKYHKITLPDTIETNKSIAEEVAPEATKSFAKPDMQKQGVLGIPRPDSFQELAAATKGTASQGLTA